MSLNCQANISHQVVLSKSKLSLFWEMKTTLPASSDFHRDFMHKDSSAALLPYTMTETAIILIARKTFLPAEFGRTDFSFCFDAECSITSGEILVFVAWKGF